MLFKACRWRCLSIVRQEKPAICRILAWHCENTLPSRSNYQHLRLMSSAFGRCLFTYFCFLQPRASPERKRANFLRPYRPPIDPTYGQILFKLYIYIFLFFIVFTIIQKCIITDHFYAVP